METIPMDIDEKSKSSERVIEFVPNIHVLLKAIIKIFKNLRIANDRNSKIYKKENGTYNEEEKNEIFKTHMEYIRNHIRDKDSLLRYRHNIVNTLGEIIGFRDINIFIIQSQNSNFNNMFMLCCSFDIIDEDFCIHILSEYNSLFDLQSANNDKNNALILSIQSNKFNVARKLLDFGVDSEEMNHSGNTALDYILVKIKYDENTNWITETIISIIARLLKVHLDNLNYEEDIDNERQYKNDNTQRYIDYFCKYREFWRPLLEQYFINDEKIDFKKSEKGYTNKVCDEVLKSNPINMEAKVTYSKPIRKRELNISDDDLPSASYPTPNIDDNNREIYYQHPFILPDDKEFFLEDKKEQQEPQEAIVLGYGKPGPQLITKMPGGKKRKTKSKKRKSHRIRNKTKKPTKKHTKKV
jgi:hypothetical protein